MVKIVLVVVPGPGATVSPARVGVIACSPTHPTIPSSILSARQVALSFCCCSFSFCHLPNDTAASAHQHPHQHAVSKAAWAPSRFTTVRCRQSSMHQWRCNEPPAPAPCGLAVCLLQLHLLLLLLLLRAAAGYTASQLFGQGVSYTYDDVIMHPGHISFGAHEVGQQQQQLSPAAAGTCCLPSAWRAC